MTTEQGPRTPATAADATTPTTAVADAGRREQVLFSKPATAGYYLAGLFLVLWPFGGEGARDLVTSPVWYFTNLTYDFTSWRYGTWLVEVASLVLGVLVLAAAVRPARRSTRWGRPETLLVAAVVFGLSAIPMAVYYGWGEVAALSSLLTLFTYHVDVEVGFVAAVAAAVMGALTVSSRPRRVVTVPIAPPGYLPGTVSAAPAGSPAVPAGLTPPGTPGTVEVPGVGVIILVTATLGLFGLIPTTMRAETARRLGLPTAPYWRAFWITFAVTAVAGIIVFMLVSISIANTMGTY